jgi:hypothetical protein
MITHFTPRNSSGEFAPQSRGRRKFRAASVFVEQWRCNKMERIAVMI